MRFAMLAVVLAIVVVAAVVAGVVVVIIIISHFNFIFICFALAFVTQLDTFVRRK